QHQRNQGMHNRTTAEDSSHLISLSQSHDKLVAQKIDAWGNPHDLLHSTAWIAESRRMVEKTPFFAGCWFLFVTV
ncbi:MAG: hypothetical protein ACK5WY_05535, partial [Holosporaceae bacterium]